MSTKTINVRTLVSEKDLEIIRQATDAVGAQLNILDEDSAVSDIIAMPADLVILDPARISETDWCELCKLYKDYPFSEGYFLLIYSSPHMTLLPVSRIIDEPLSLNGIARAIKRVETMTNLSNHTLSYDEMLICITDRVEEVNGFEEFLRNKTSWLTSPASTRFHLSHTGGLVEHSLNVANTLLKLRAVLAPEISEESCIIAGLYHDIGKIGMPGKPYYLPNPSEWHVKNRGIAYIVNEDIVHMDIATRSLYLVSQHITLTDEEAQAIRYHDGQYIDENKSVAHKETKLTRLLQYADNWSGGVLENN